MTPDTAQTAKTGSETRAQADPAYEDAEVSECRAGSRTEPRTASDILRMIVHGRHCCCDLCTTEEAK